MDILEQLENCVDGLLGRQDELRQDNARLQAELEHLAQEKNALAEENNNLHAMLEQERGMRSDALNRVEALLRKIQEHGATG